MYLYDRERDTINVYTMISNCSRSAEFKKREMEKSIPFEERVLKASTNDEKILENHERPIPWSNVQYRTSGLWGGMFKHSISPYEMTNEEKTRQLELLNNYYNGVFNYCPIALIEDYNKEKQKLEIIKYFLLTRPYHNMYSYCTMEDIISIPKSLYLLQLLEKGEFHSIINEDISRQLETFDVSKSPVQSISIGDLEKMYDYGLLPGSYDHTMAKVKTTEKILRKVR